MRLKEKEKKFDAQHVYDIAQAILAENLDEELLMTTTPETKYVTTTSETKHERQACRTWSGCCPQARGLGKA